MHRPSRIMFTLFMLTVTSCMVIIPKNSEVKTWLISSKLQQAQAQEMKEKNKLCPVFELPELEEIPEIPKISDKEMQNTSLVIDRLFTNIGDLRDQIQSDRERIRESYKSYIEQCRGKK